MGRPAGTWVWVCRSGGEESPHTSSYAGYLLLVMVTLLAHGRRGVMMEDGAR